jgi:hypothetical protein
LKFWETVMTSAAGDRSPQPTPYWPSFVSFFAARRNSVHVHGSFIVGILTPACLSRGTLTKTL